jgi:tRNA(Ile)-lysidine synthase
MSVNEPWIDRVERRLARWCDHGLGKAWMVAVSGGGDSVGLLRILHHLAGPLGLQLSVAHLDHGARGEAARADAAFAAALAGSLDLPFVLGTWRPTRSAHFESDARRARYDWLTDTARARGASVIAVGHTRDDQAETILHRIVRGTGPRGLAGMPRTRILASKPRITLVRPLLGVSHRDLRDYLAELKQPFREDESNANLARTRARIRHDLLPKLAEDYNPNVVRALVRLGSLASSLERALGADLRALERSVVLTRAPDCVVLKHGVMRSIPAFQRTELLRRVWRNAGWPEASMSASRWRRLAALVDNNDIPRLEIGARVEVFTEQFFLVLRRVPAPASSALETENGPTIALAVPGLTAIPWAGGEIDARIDPSPDTPSAEAIDLEQVSLPLVVRTAAAGDRFDPLGMDGRSMALADFFRGRKLRREHRTHVPLVCDQTGIIWVVGHRIADRVKVTKKTRRTLGLLWEDRNDADVRSDDG